MNDEIALFIGLLIWALFSLGVLFWVFSAPIKKRISQFHSKPKNKQKRKPKL